MVDDPESRQREPWFDGSAPEELRKHSRSPLSTQRERVAFESGPIRVEHNLVRNAATDDRGFVVRIALAEASHYMSVVIPLLSDEWCVMCSRYHYAAGGWSLEFPRFCCPTSDAGWGYQVKANLLGEMGLKARNVRLLGAAQIDPANISTSALVVLAEHCESSKKNRANPRTLLAGAPRLRLDKLDALVRHGEIVCGLTLSALALLRAWRQPGARTGFL